MSIPRRNNSTREWRNCTFMHSVERSPFLPRNMQLLKQVWTLISHVLAVDILFKSFTRARLHVGPKNGRMLQTWILRQVISNNFTSLCITTGNFAYANIFLLKVFDDVNSNVTRHPDRLARILRAQVTCSQCVRCLN